MRDVGYFTRKFTNAAGSSARCIFGDELNYVPVDGRGLLVVLFISWC